MKVLETDRLELRWAGPEDAAFILRLVNEPAWKRYIGDRGVRTEEEARSYIERGFRTMYARLGFGLYVVQRRDGGAAVGICGILKRDSLADVDLGFAFLEEYQGRGYAFESAVAVLAQGARSHGFTRVAAVATPDNRPSERLLVKLGFRFERTAVLAAGQPAVNIYALDLPQSV